MVACCHRDVDSEGSSIVCPLSRIVVTRSPPGLWVGLLLSRTFAKRDSLGHLGWAVLNSWCLLLRRKFPQAG